MSRERQIREEEMVPTKFFVFIFAAVVGIASLNSIVLADEHRTPSPAGAKVYFVAPEDGAVVSSPFAVKFGLVGMGVAPATTEYENTGHHHIVINGELPDDLNDPIPADETYRHFGGGQTETMLELEPGEYTLQLLLGDLNHVPHDPPVVSEKIMITVE
jgi:hypothetical protein